MTEVAVEELAFKIDHIWAAVTRLEKQLAEISNREPATIRTNHPHIVRVQGICGGRPIIEGTRLSVKLIVGWVRMGKTPEEIIEHYPELTIAQVTDALEYYQDRPEEVEAEFVEEKRYLEVELSQL